MKLQPLHTVDCMQTYEELYQDSITYPERFWATEGKRLEWIKPYTQVQNWSFEGDIQIRWYQDGTLNACVNCLDRHLTQKAQKIALIWEGDEPHEKRQFTYQELFDDVCRFANVLKNKGIQKGDRVTIYMPQVPEAIIAMLACTRIGAVHSVVFGGFSAKALAERIHDSESKLIITADEGLRGGKKIPLKKSVDEALKSCSSVQTSIVVNRTGEEIAWNEGRDFWYHELMKDSSPVCDPVEMNAEDPLFILYTSGSTGKPKGVLHTTGGYLVYASLTHEKVFDFQENDVYWCTADIGWITGHSYVVYGPLSNGATILIYEGIPTHPTPARLWEMVDRYQVSLFYTAPTAIRALMKEGIKWPKSAKRGSLRLLGTVGEPINVEAWEWYYTIIGNQSCQILDTWWQTETGGIMISALPKLVPSKPGSASKPFFGIQPVLMGEGSHPLKGAGEGPLCLKSSWPGQARTLYKNHEGFISTYFKSYPGYYFTGDGARRDEEGLYWITGRIDDVINVSGHRLGTAEIEDAINSHEAVVESAVIGCPHEIKGQGICAYIILKDNIHIGPALKQEIILHVRHLIGPIATLDLIYFTPALPKTRSGKIMRRILRKLAAGEADSLGDISTLADPSVVEDLVHLTAKST
ncbi:MAG: acetate--CoA ligase [Alphaproteobacteria bacterium]|nr:acetate--CoA ligase [Alphaproteobacteria bacterium]